MAKRAKKNSVKAETKPDPTLDLSEGLSDVPPTHEQVTIDFDAICVEQHGLTNSRKSLDQTEIDQLKASIRKDGLLQPIGLWRVPVLVTNEDGEDEEVYDYVLSWGYRRHEAIRQIRLETPSAFENIHAVVFEGTLSDAMILNMRENSDRKNLGYVDEADYLKLLYKVSGIKNQYALAARFNKSQAWVSLRIKFAERACEELRDACRSGAIGTKQAQRIIQTEDHLEQAALVAELIDPSKKLGTKKDKKKHITAKDVIKLEQAIEAATEGDINVDSGHIETLKEVLRWCRGVIDEQALIYKTSPDDGDAAPIVDSQGDAVKKRKTRKRRTKKVVAQASA
jgi:ParB/RepB/Spo0J family partition protein